MSEATQYPRFLYKRGTGKALGDNGLFTAESVLVRSEEHLAECLAKFGELCESPVEAAVAALEEPKPTKKAK